MKIHRLQITGLRSLKQADIYFGDATFCIGPNNSGKSTVLVALEHLLAGKKRLSETEYYSEQDADTGETKIATESVVLEAEFRNVPLEAEEWRGFKGRIFSYDPPEGSDETGLAIHYRKSFPLAKDVVVELRQLKRTLKAEFNSSQKPQDFIDNGAPEEQFVETFSDLTKKISKTDNDKLHLIDELWDLEDEEEWFPNPGGIPGNVLARLPRYLRIPAEAAAHEIEDPKRGVLGKTLGQLFEDVRDRSDNYKNAQQYLDLLSRELDPADDQSEFGKMMGELNKVLSRIFPESALHATADLSDPDKALVPSFDIAMSSNVTTAVSHQGTGMVRSAVFGMLRFRQKWLAKREGDVNRALIIGFEEPEIYLHPSAANQMRDAIYELSGADSQIVATTHSPYLIDLSRKPRQILNRFSNGSPEQSADKAMAFNATDQFIQLENDEKSHVKMLLRADDYFARAFFTKRVIIVEGDTEDIVLRETLDKLAAETKLSINSEFEVIKARGKASIISLAKYFNALGISYRVMHDRDQGTPNAEIFNAPIAQAAGEHNVVILEECLEDVLGYQAPAKEKPYRAYRCTADWGPNWHDVPDPWRAICARLFDGYITA